MLNEIVRRRHIPHAVMRVNTIRDNRIDQDLDKPTTHIEDRQTDQILHLVNIVIILIAENCIKRK